MDNVKSHSEVTGFGIIQVDKKAIPEVIKLI